MENFKREKNPLIDTFATAQQLMEALDQRVGTQKWHIEYDSAEESLYFGITEKREVYVISSRDDKNIFVQSFPTIYDAEQFVKTYVSAREAGTQ